GARRRARHTPRGRAPGGGAAGGRPGAAGGPPPLVPRRDRFPQRRLDRLPVRHHQRAVHGKARLGQQPGEDRPGSVLVDPGGGPVGHRHRERPHRTSSAVVPLRPAIPVPGYGRRQRPVLPPVFSSTRTALLTAARSSAFTMSISASAATATEVSASISAPVRSAVRTVAAISTAPSPTWRSTVTAWIAIGWQRGTRSGVRLAAWIPAIRATASASPLGTS